MLSRMVLILVLTFLSTTCIAQEKLPRVLILGDSIYQQPAREIEKELKGKAIVVFPRIEQGEIRNSHFALRDFDSLVGKEEWDVIHFNVGLGDLVHRAPNLKDFRVLPAKAGGVRATEPNQYRSNLEKLVERLQSTNAKLIWASTTPIRHSTTGVFVKGAAVEYNRIAAKIMKSKNVAINDMHTHVKGLIDMNRPAAHGADPFHFDRKSIAGPILKSIQTAIKQGDRGLGS